jgi:hypothetical protein
MKNAIWILSGVSAVAAYFIARHQEYALRHQPVEVLAHKLEAAWADHHTVA